jgi:hypothetical protein
MLRKKLSSYTAHLVSRWIKGGEKTLAQKMTVTIHDLSMICRELSWHKTGVHLFIASEELKKMVEANKTEQPQYQIRRKK